MMVDEAPAEIESLVEVRVMNESDSPVGFGPDMVLQSHVEGAWQTRYAMLTKVAGVDALTTEQPSPLQTVPSIGLEAPARGTGPEESILVPALSPGEYRLLRTAGTGNSSFEMAGRLIVR